MSHAQERHLTQAPITEAVVDLRVIARGDFASHIANLRAEFASSFDKVEEPTTIQSMFLVDPTGAARSAESPGPKALIFRSSSRYEALQASDEGFAFSKLRPYTTWEDVRDSARRFWAEYRKVVEVSCVNRIGVRYINQFRISSGRQIGDYLAVLPSVPETIQAEQISGALLRLTIRDSTSNVSARVITLLNTDELGTLVVIDTDSYLADVEFDPDSDELWERLEELRRMKNRIFFGTITETAAQEFDK